MTNPAINSEILELEHLIHQGQIHINRLKNEGDDYSIKEAIRNTKKVIKSRKLRLKELNQQLKNL